MQKSEDQAVVRGLAWTSVAVGAGATVASITVTPLGAFGRF